VYIKVSPLHQGQMLVPFWLHVPAPLFGQVKGFDILGTSFFPPISPLITSTRMFLSSTHPLLLFWISQIESLLHTIAVFPRPWVDIQIISPGWTRFQSFFLLPTYYSYVLAFFSISPDVRLPRWSNSWDFFRPLYPSFERTDVSETSSHSCILDPSTCLFLSKR